MIWLFMAGLGGAIVLLLLSRFKGQARGERRVLERMAKAEQKKVAERLEAATRDKERAEKAAEVASRARETVEHEVATDRALAGASDEPIGALRKRLGRLTGNRGGGDTGGSASTN